MTGYNLRTTCTEHAHYNNILPIENRKRDGLRMEIMEKMQEFKRSYRVCQSEGTSEGQSSNLKMRPIPENANNGASACRGTH